MGDSRQQPGAREAARARFHTLSLLGGAGSVALAGMACGAAAQAYGDHATPLTVAAAPSPPAPTPSITGTLTEQQLMALDFGLPAAVTPPSAPTAARPRPQPTAGQPAKSALRAPSVPVAAVATVAAARTSPAAPPPVPLSTAPPPRPAPRPTPASPPPVTTGQS